MSNSEVIHKAVEKAVARGWAKDLEGKVFEAEISFAMDRFGTVSIWSINQPVGTGMENEGKFSIFNQEFAKALWSEVPVDNHGWPLKTIKVWAEQVAVKHADKLYNVDPSRKHGVIMETGAINFMNPEPDALVEVTKIQYQLEDMVGAIPFETHAIKSVEVDANTTPAWHYHLQHMVVAKDPIQYLRENI